MILRIALALLLLPVLASAQSSPYPASTVIQSIAWDCAGEVTGAGGSDLFPATWHSDGHIYLPWGDGWGFESPSGSEANKSSVGISRLTGTPTSIGAQDILCDNSSVCANSPSSTGINPDSWSDGSNGGKITGVISVSGTLYGWETLQNGTFPNVTYRLVWSTNNGVNWNVDNETFPAGAGNFKPRSFVNFGQSNAGARDGFIYFTGHNQWSNILDLNDLYMGRVSVANIQNKSAYEYFSGTAASPAWSTTIADRTPVFTDPANVTRSIHISYNPGIDRYLLMTSHFDNSTEEGDQDPGLFEAPEPWGPWSTVWYETGSWCGYSGELSLGYAIPTKTPDWMSLDGTVIHAIWSGGNSSVLDRYHQIKGTMTLEDPPPDPPPTEDAPTVNSVQTAQSVGAQTAYSTTNFGVSGSNVALAACVYNVSANDTDTDSVTWNDNEAFTLVAQQGDGDTDPGTHSLWYLPNPTQMTENVDVAMQGAATSIVTVFVLTEASQNVPTLSNTTGPSGASTIQADLTTTLNDTLLIACVGTGSATETWSYGAGQTERSNESNASGDAISQATSTEVKAAAGLETLSQTRTSTNFARMVVVGIEPAAEPPPDEEPTINVCVSQDTPGAVTSFSTDNCAVSGTDVVLLACINSESDAANEEPTAVMWNGTEEFTLIGQKGSGATDARIHGWWALVDPTQTTENVDITTAGASTSIVHVLILTNAKQSLPTLFAEAECSNCDTVSGDLTTVVDNTFMLTCASTSAGGDTYLHGDGQQELTDVANNSGDGLSASTSLEVQPTAGLETLSSTASSVRNVVEMVMIGVEPAAAGPATTRRRGAVWSFR